MSDAEMSESDAEMSATKKIFPTSSIELTDNFFSQTNPRKKYIEKNLLNAVGAVGRIFYPPADPPASQIRCGSCFKYDAVGAVGRKQIFYLYIKVLVFYDLVLLCNIIFLKTKTLHLRVKSIFFLRQLRHELESQLLMLV